MSRAIVVVPLLLVACGALNPAFDETDGNEGTGTASAATESRSTTTNVPTSDGTTIDGTSGGPTSNGPTSNGPTSNGPNGTAESSTSGTDEWTNTGTPVCPEVPRFGISYEYECNGEGRFVEQRACVRRSALAGAVDELAIQLASPCNAPNVCETLALSEDVLTVDNFPLAEAITANEYLCGPMLITGFAKDGRCVLDGVFLFDGPPSNELLLGFANFSDRNEPFVAEADMQGIPFETPPESGLSCGSEPQTCGDSGWLAVRFGSAVVGVGEPPTPSTITVGPDQLEQEVIVFNYDLLRDPQCRTRGAWAVAHEDLAELFPESP